MHEISKLAIIGTDYKTSEQIACTFRSVFRIRVVRAEVGRASEVEIPRADVTGYDKGSITS